MKKRTPNMEMVTELADLRQETSLCFKELAFKELPTNPETLAQPCPHYWYSLLQLLSVCPSVHSFKLLSIHLLICLSRIKLALHLHNLQGPATVQLLDSWALAQLSSAAILQQGLWPHCYSCVPFCSSLVRPLWNSLNIAVASLSLCKHSATAHIGL